MEVKKIIEQENLKTREDINNYIQNLVGNIMQELLNKEFDEHMNYKKGCHSSNTNSRNGISSKKNVKTNFGEIEIEMPRDRNSSFDPVIVPKRKTLLMDTADTIALMYAKGNSLSDIKELLKQIYGVDVSEQFISESTKMVNDEIIEWRKRKLQDIYPFIYMDCLYVDVKEEMKSVSKAVYVALGVDIEGNKEVLDFWIGDSESSSFWYGVLEDLKARGVKDILYLCTDGVSGFKGILEDVFPKTTHQRCIVHIIRNLTKCIPKKEWKNFCNDLKNVYKAPNLESAKDSSKIILDKWKNNKILYKKLEENIPHLLQLFDYTENIRKIVYTTNPIESLNSALRKVTNGKGSFVNEQALSKVLYLRIKSLKEKWNKRRTSNWQMVLNELYLLHEERIEKYINI